MAHLYAPLRPSETLELRDELVRNLWLYQDWTLAEMRRARGTEAEFPKPAFAEIVRLLQTAVPVLWRRDLWQAAQSGEEAFVDTRTNFTQKPIPPLQLWIPDVDFFYDEERRKQIQLEEADNLVCMFLVNELALRRNPWVHPGHRLGLMNFMFFNKSAGRLDYESLDKMSELDLARLYAEYSRYTMRMFVIPQDEPLVAGSPFLPHVAMVEFLSLDIVDVQKGQPDRAERRRLIKAGRKIPEWRVVELRRRAIQRHFGEGHLVDWSCQWTVAGHWRKQWYPSTQEHRPIFIDSYVKGPGDKPLKDHAKTIFYVRR